MYKNYNASIALKKIRQAVKGGSLFKWVMQIES